MPQSAATLHSAELTGGASGVIVGGVSCCVVGGAGVEDTLLIELVCERDSVVLLEVLVEVNMEVISDRGLPVPRPVADPGVVPL